MSLDLEHSLKIDLQVRTGAENMFLERLLHLSRYLSGRGSRRER